MRELTAAERAELTESYKSSRVADVVRRSHAVILSADGWAIPPIAGLLWVNQAIIHRWLDRFEAAGSVGLPTHWSDGRLLARYLATQMLARRGSAHQHPGQICLVLAARKLRNTRRPTSFPVRSSDLR